jgi:thiamine biosynthesis lipoprotein
MVELGFDFVAMATPCEIRAEAADERALRAAAREAIDEVLRIEAKFSRYLPGSVVSRINAAAGAGIAVAIDAETMHLMRFAGELHRASGGRFDITSGALRQCWNLREARVPTRAELDACLARIGWAKVLLGDATVELGLPGMEIDLGGIGKEYACDRAAAVLLAAGIASGYVNLGGDLRVLGPRHRGAWRFGIQHPRREAAVLGTLAMERGALATSGDSERSFVVEGRRFGHLLDARTGWPVDAWQSVSVLAPTCSAAGAASTLACLLGAQAMDFLASEQVPYLAVDAHGRMHSHGLADTFTTAVPDERMPQGALP